MLEHEDIQRELTDGWQCASPSHDAFADDTPLTEDTIHTLATHTSGATLSVTGVDTNAVSHNLVLSIEQSLSANGWNARVATKQAAFTEYERARAWVNQAVSEVSAGEEQLEPIAIVVHNGSQRLRYNDDAIGTPEDINDPDDAQLADVFAIKQDDLEYVAADDLREDNVQFVQAAYGEHPDPDHDSNDLDTVQNPNVAYDNAHIHVYTVTDIEPDTTNTETHDNE